MLIFNLTIHHLWGRVLAKFQEARAIAYADVVTTFCQYADLAQPVLRALHELVGTLNV
jgi:hypothetical protein